MNGSLQPQEVAGVDYVHALVNILEDFGTEKLRLEESEIVRSEQAMRASLREKDVLLKEVHHRVKNNLQVISSLLNLQARRLTDPATREIFVESQNRVQSIALVHEKLHQSSDLSHVDFSEYTLTLLDGLFHAYDATERGISKTVDVGGARLTIDMAIPCGLIITELVTNALKHAFPGARRGTVLVMLREEGDDLYLAVEDDGVGMPAGDPSDRGSLGLELVLTFAEQLDAKMEITRERGTAFHFRFPKVST
jgi:two-component system, sensor histidine kinase PdtaS